MNEQAPMGHRLIIDWETRSAASAYANKYGGLPSNGTKLGTCKGCGHHHHLLFQIDLFDPNLSYLGLDSLDYLFIFTCLNCASYEKEMYYRLNDRGKEIVVLQETPGVFVHQYPDYLDEHPVSYRHLKHDEYPLTEEIFSNLLSREAKHQLGGMPTWIQDKAQISCLDCGQEMEYIAMIDSELYVGKDGFREKGHMFGDEGILYLFVCRECGIFAAKAQNL
jgi:uncharacterized protein YwqG